MLQHRVEGSSCAWQITVDYSSDFDFQMNMGGAMGDLNWLDEGDMPMVSFHAPHDQFASLYQWCIGRSND